jgi:spermidine/putrescine transport system substrate-binding protein
MPLVLGFFRAFLCVIIALALAAGFWACEKKHAVLTVLIWSDYINPALVSEFQKLTGCTVRLEIYSDNEELKAMLREGRFAADVIVPSSYEIQTLRDEGFLMPLNDRKLKNRKHIDEKIVKLFGLDEYASVAVPYFVAPTGLAFRPDRLQHEVGMDSADVARIGWSVLEAPLTDGSGKVASRATLLNDKREAIGVALLASGSNDVNASDPERLQRAQELLKRWFEAGLRINGKSYQYQLFADPNSANSQQGKVLGHAWLGDVLPLSPEVLFELPAEGFIVTCDVLAIVSTSRNVDLAHQFINYLCEPKVCAQNMEWSLYRAPNEKAYESVKEKLESPASDFLAAAWLEKGQVLRPLAPQAERLYDDLWNKFQQYREE